MPFLHLDARNLHKELWYNAVKDHPLGFEVAEWNDDQNKNLVQWEYPDLDTQLYPRACISILSSLQKLISYGGIAVRGEDIAPIRGVELMLKDWKLSDYPRNFTVRGYGYPVFVDKTTIMAAAKDDRVCKKYRDEIVKHMVERTWQHPSFDSDVSIM